MKPFAILFSLYLLALSFVPCADIAENKEALTLSEVSLHTQDTHHHEGIGDICSPFCACACCHIQVSLEEITPIIEVVKTEEVSQEEILYLSHYQYASVDSFLDPPRIG